VRTPQTGLEILGRVINQISMVECLTGALYLQCIRSAVIQGTPKKILAEAARALDQNTIFTNLEGATV
jgi:hypothetical protein